MKKFNWQYERRLLAYVDAMGFRALVDQSVSDSKVLQDMYRGLMRLSRERAREFPVSTFSDHIACSVKADDEAMVEHLLHSVVDFSAALLANLGIFCRGAITIGQLVHDDSVIYGPALVQAHEFEQQVAIYPRIIVAGNIHVPSRLLRGLVGGPDGMNYINMFWPGWRLECNKKGNREARKDFLWNVAGWLKHYGQMKLAPREFSKVAWFVAHYNSQMKALNEKMVLHLEILSHRDVWVSRGSIE